MQNTPFVFDYHDGKYGYNTDTERGADTFHPFSSSYFGLVGTNVRNTDAPRTITLDFEPNYAMLIITSGNETTNPDAIRYYISGRVFGFGTAGYFSTSTAIQIDGKNLTWKQDQTINLRNVYLLACRY